MSKSIRQIITLCFEQGFYIGLMLEQIRNSQEEVCNASNGQVWKIYKTSTKTKLQWDSKQMTVTLIM